MKTQAEQTEIPIPLAGTKLTALQLAQTRVRDARLAFVGTGAREKDIEVVGQLGPEWAHVFIRCRSGATLAIGKKWDELVAAAKHLRVEEAKELTRFKRTADRERAKNERECASKRSDKAP